MILLNLLSLEEKKLDPPASLSRDYRTAFNTEFHFKNRFLSLKINMKLYGIIR